MHFVWNEFIRNFSSISMCVLFPFYRKRNYFTINIAFQSLNEDMGFSSLPVDELTGWKLQLIQWCVLQCNSLGIDLQEHCWFSVAESCRYSQGPYWAVPEFLTQIIPLQALWGLPVGRPLCLVGNSVLTSWEGLCADWTLRGNTWHLAELPQQGGWAVAGKT